MIFDERLIYPTGFTLGPDEEMNFSFSSKLNPPFESLAEPPSELDGKNFFSRAASSLQRGLYPT